MEIFIRKLFNQAYANIDMPIDVFKKEIVKVLSHALGKEVDISTIEVPPDPLMGDYAFPCFSLAKEMKKNPNEIAQSLLKKIKPNKHIDSAKAIGPYVNFFVKKDVLFNNVLLDVFLHKEKYGKKKIKGKTVLLEGWQPNTHKAFHIGHVRNAVLGESVARILEFYGYKVIRISYMGDIGAHVAKWVWYFNKFYKGSIPKDNVGKWAGNLYTLASVKEEENEVYKDEINEVHKKLEEGDKELIKLWKKTRDLCLKGFWKIYKELDCKIKDPYFESEVETPGKKIVKNLEEKGLAKYDEGAIVADLKEYGLGVFVLLKNNGASLYSTKDIALAYLKSKNYKFDLSLYIVASEQEFYFQQLFKTLEIIKYKDASKLRHVSYGLVMLKEGKMSSREGNIILYDDLRDKLMKKALDAIEERKLDAKKKGEIMGNVAFGAMKFTMLNQDSNREIIFDPEQALSFEGETGPYILYTYARACSILRKYKNNVKVKVDFSLLDNEEEKKIVKILAEFPDVVERAALSYKPHLICRGLLDLSQTFNEYYHKHKILQEDKKLEEARILLTFCVKNVIKNGLSLLSIKVADEM